MPALCPEGSVVFSRGNHVQQLLESFLQEFLVTIMFLYINISMVSLKLKKKPLYLQFCPLLFQ